MNDTTETTARHTETHILTWNGIRIEIVWEPNWLNLTSLPNLAHLDITSTEPARAPLPITETGYRSHFTSPETVASMGGPVAFVEAWLESESRCPDWLEKSAGMRQFSLF